MIKVYVNVTCDIFHYGHVSFFRKARSFGDYLIVGVCSDEEVASHKWPPIMTLHERAAVIEGSSHVDEVISGVPFEITESFIKEHQIDIVVATKSYSKEVLIKFYTDPQKMNILKLVDYEEGISTSEIVERCAQSFKIRKKLKKLM